MKKFLRTSLVPLIFVALCAIFFYPTLLSGKLPVPTDTLIGLYHPWRDLYASTNPRGVPYKNFLITDPVRQQIPWKKLVVDSFKQGSLPLWNPYSFSGASLLGNIQAGALSPMNVLFVFLPFPAAWAVSIILQPLLGGLFLYVFLKRKNIQPAASLLGSIAWGFGGFFVAWLTWGTIDQTALWLPLALFAVDAIAEAGSNKTKIFWSCTLAISLSFAFFAGHAQIAVYIFVFAGIYAVRKVSWWLIAAAVIAVLISSIQSIPFIQFLMHSARVADSGAWLKEGWFLPWQNLVQFIAPDFFGNPATLNYWGIWNYGEFIGYIGILPLILALFAIVTRRDRLTRFFAVAAGIVFLFLLPTPIAKLPYQFHLPIISSLQPTRLMVLVDFCLAVLAALGLDAYIRKPDKKIFLIWGLFMLVLLGLWGYAASVHLAVAKHNLILPGILLAVSIGVLLLKRWKYIMIASAIVLTVFDLFRFGWKFTPFTPAEYFFPTTQAITFLQSQQKPFRVMSLDARLLPPNTASYYGIESVEGYDPVYDARYEEFIAALNRGKPDITPPFGFNRIITVSSIDSPLLPFLNVQYILSLTDIKDSRLELSYQEGQTKIYWYKKALPRIYPVESIVRADSKQKAIDILYDKSFNAAKQAVVEDDISVSQAPVASGDHIDIMTESDQQIRAISSLANDHFVVIANAYDAGWKAYIDSKVTPIYRTNYIFQGIYVPKGDHTVVLKFEGQRFMPGI